MSYLDMEVALTLAWSNIDKLEAKVKELENKIKELEIQQKKVEEQEYKEKEEVKQPSKQIVEWSFSTFKNPQFTTYT